MRLLQRTADVITGNRDLENLHTLTGFPVFMGSVETPASDDLVADMTWSIARDSGLIQLKNLLPLDVLYQAQTTTAAIGPTWMEHHRTFAKFLHSYAPDAVLELGGAHGILSVEYKTFADIPWTILEPNPSPTNGCTATFIRGFFDDTFVFTKEFDVLVHSHVFEHLYEPAKFMSHLAGFLRPGQKMIFSVPNLAEWLKRCYTNAINFEHTVFLTEPYIDFLLAQHGFRTIEKRHVMDGHSIFYSVERDPGVAAVPLPPELYAENRAIYEGFTAYYEKVTREINARVTEWPGEVYLFGAHVFAQYLIAFGLDTSRVQCILDNDVRKQGRRLYGTSLKVASPKILAGRPDAAVILKAGIYNEEIKRDIRAAINDKVVYFE